MASVRGNLSDGRVKTEYGIDFTDCEGRQKTTAGTAIKFRGTYPTTMGYSHETYGGIRMTGNMYATTASGDDAGKSHARILYVLGYPTGASECAAGVARIESSRSSSYPFGTTGTGGWGGAQDEGLRIAVYNAAANTNSKGGIRGLQVYVRQYSGGQIANIYGAEVSVDDRGSGGANGQSVATIQGMNVAVRVNGVCATRVTGLKVEDTSQGTISATTAATNNLLLLESSGARAGGSIVSGIHMQTTGSGTGWTYALSFQTAAGKEGFTAVSAASQGGNIDGYIKIYDVATAQALYLPCYDAAPA